MNNDAVRVPMPRPMASIMRPEDVRTRPSEPLPTGRRYSMDISEELLSHGMLEGLAYAFDDMCRFVARHQRPMLENEARSWMTKPENRDRIEELVTEVIRATVREWVKETLASAPSPDPFREPQ